VSYPALAAVAVASLDLQVVRLVRGAIAANLQGTPGPLGTVVKPKPTGDLAGAAAVVDPTPRFEPRPVHTPTPRFEPRFTITPDPRIVPFDWPVPVPPPLQADLTPGDAPLPPPWRMPIWNTPLELPAVVKQTLHRPDIRHKGTLLDRFA
jgi:hypothetical protein